MNRIGIIGFGNMGRNLQQLLSKNNKIYLSDPNLVCDNKQIWSNMDNIKKSEIIFLTTKPNNIRGVCRDIAINSTDKTIVSCAAGISISEISCWIGKSDQHIIRCMPNIPISVGLGSIAWYGHYDSRLDKLFNGVSSVWLDQEEQIDAATVISGCSPAYLSVFIESYLKIGQDIGLDSDTSKKLLLGSFKGTLEMLGEKTCENIIQEVASKGGATEKALQELQHNGFHNIIKNSVLSSLDRIKKLG